MPAESRIDQMREAVQNHGARVIEGKLNVDLMAQGLLIRVSVFGTGIFDRNLSFEELGISSTDEELKKYIKPGQKSYAPDYSKRLGSWGTQCRQAVSKYCLHLETVDALTASRSWRFLHYDAYADFRQRWDELMALRDQIITDIEYDYRNLLEDAVLFYRETFGESFDRLQDRYRLDGGIALHIPSLHLVFGPGDRAAYVQWVEDHVRADFPTLNTIRETVTAEYVVNFMFDSASLAQAQAAEEEALAAQRAAALEAARDRDEIWQMATTREAREEAIRQAELERMRETVSQQVNPYVEAMDQLLKELAGHIHALLEGLESNGSFRGRSLDRVGNMVELFRIMGGKNLEDPEIERLLNDLQSRREAETTDATRETTTNQIAQGLVDLRQHVRSQSEVYERRLQAQSRAGALEL